MSLVLMTMFLKFLPFKAPGSWTFKDPDTGKEYQADSKLELLQKITTYRDQNTLPEIEMLPAVLENYLCHQPENIGKCGRAELTRSLWQTMRGGVVLLVNMLYPKIVSKEEADRRAAICVACPHNVFPDKGRFIKWSDQVAEASVPGKRSQYHNQLGNCEICSCPLRAKVFYGGKIDLDPEEVDKMPEECWQRVEYIRINHGRNPS